MMTCRRRSVPIFSAFDDKGEWGEGRVIPPLSGVSFLADPFRAALMPACERDRRFQNRIRIHAGTLLHKRFRFESIEK